MELPIQAKEEKKEALPKPSVNELEASKTLRAIKSIQLQISDRKKEIKKKKEKYRISSYFSKDQDLLQKVLYQKFKKYSLVLQFKEGEQKIKVAFSSQRCGNLKKSPKTFIEIFLRRRNILDSFVEYLDNQLKGKTTLKEFQEQMHLLLDEELLFSIEVEGALITKQHFLVLKFLQKYFVQEFTFLSELAQL